jgi:nucleoside-diphosphate-sugar epimerase
MSTALVIGGTGPTGPHVVNGLLERGYDVTILHSGRHESPLIPDSVAHIHTDAFDVGAVMSAVAGTGVEAPDVLMVMYGRLRDLAVAFADRCGRFLSVGGVPVYRGFGWPDSLQPTGMRVPTREDAPRALPTDNPKVVKMAQTEDVVFAHHPTATHFRYPRLYGPDQVVPKEWCIVRRLLDGRRRLIVADGGLPTMTMAYTLNAAQALLCALDRPDAAAGRNVNVSDEHAVSMRQWISLLAGGLGIEVELVNLPWDLARPMHPQYEGSHDHRLLSTELLRGELGYRDLLDVHEALPLTARWLVDNPLYGTVTEQALRDPFDYEAEDRLIDAWQRAVADLMPVVEAADPGYVDRYAPTSVDMHLGIDR